MRIWFDADNAPHVPVMRPVAAELSRMGHEVFFTARDRASTCELLDLYGLPYILTGGGSSKSGAGKVIGTLARALSLAAAVRGRRPDLSFGHGSRSLPPASALLGVPSVTMYDYEWVNPSIFNRLCRNILLPEAVGSDRAREAGIDTRKIRFFPGFKEQLYLSDREFGEIPEEIAELTGGEPYVLLRPPAVTAHYHNPQSEGIFHALLENLSRRKGIRILFVPRSGDDPLTGAARRAGAVVPGRVLDGPDLVWNACLIAGGGGTMTREAAVLGVPSISFFMGRPGRVDEHLASLGRLAFVRDAASALALDPASFERLPRLGNPGLPALIAGLILGRSEVVPVL